MWLFAQEGFLSIVENRDNPDELLVRARVKGDIERYFPEAKVIHNGGSDYAYRAFIDRKIVAETVEKIVLGINYDNYKDNIYDEDRRFMAYADIWSVMRMLQVSTEDRS